MSYAVAGLVREYRCAGYPQHEPMVPHGISVVVNAPSVFRATARRAGAPPRGRRGARRGHRAASGREDAGACLSRKLVELMRAAGVPNGVSGVGYGEADIDALTRGSIVQKRLVDNAPMPVDEASMRALFRGALSYW